MSPAGTPLLCSIRCKFSPVVVIYKLFNSTLLAYYTAMTAVCEGRPSVLFDKENCQEGSKHLFSFKNSVTFDILDFLAK